MVDRQYLGVNQLELQLLVDVLDGALLNLKVARLVYRKDHGLCGSTHVFFRIAG